MATRAFGIFSAQVPDKVGETVLLDGIQTDFSHGCLDEHESDDFFHKIGSVDRFKKIYSDKDCATLYEKKCWDYAKAPFLYGEVTLFDDESHPNSMAAAALLKFCSRPDVETNLHPGFSLDGGVIERKDINGNTSEDGKILSQTMATGIAMTVKPACPKARAWLFNDLAKSEMAGDPPAVYWEALKKSTAKSSVFTNKDFTLLMKLHKLKKSIEDYAGGFTSLRCYGCGQGVRFFKSSKDIPNVCSKCGKSHTMAGLWTALNK